MGWTNFECIDIGKVALQICKTKAIVSVLRLNLVKAISKRFSFQAWIILDFDQNRDASKMVFCIQREKRDVTHYSLFATIYLHFIILFVIK